MTDVREEAERIVNEAFHSFDGVEGRHLDYSLDGERALVERIAAALTGAERLAHEAAAAEWQEGYERERAARQRAEVEAARLREKAQAVLDTGCSCCAWGEEARQIQRVWDDLRAELREPAP